MQRPRFKRHWDDRKWQNPINSMTESVKSNMFSSASFLSSPGLSFLCPPFTASLLSSLKQDVLCLNFSLHLILSQAVFLSLRTYVFFFLSVHLFTSASLLNCLSFCPLFLFMVSQSASRPAPPGSGAASSCRP